MKFPMFPKRSVSPVVFLLCFFVQFSCSQQVVPQDVVIQDKPTNIILMIGDGMGLPHISAHYYKEKKTTFSKFKNIGLMTTHSANNIVTDSGAGATAFSTGYKSQNDVVGKDKDGIVRPNMMEIAKEHGFKTGIVTTASLLDATAAAFYAHQDNRYWTDSIAKNLLDSNIDLMIGGGLKYFDGGKDSGKYRIRDFEDKGFYIDNIFDTPIQEISLGGSKRMIYFTGKENVLINAFGKSHLKIATKKALNYFKRKNPFILMIEGAQIDKVSHSHNTEEMLKRMKGFDMALDEVLKFVEKDKNTLLIVTADHATGGLAILDGSEYGKVKSAWSTNGHTGEWVPVFAYGPGSDHFTGVLDNTDIFKRCMKLLNLPEKNQNNNQ